ncbi:integrating conjugative element protein (TIGR03756 family) [Pseudomonas sp. SORGH_AS199]|nr:integrating conjugative element protein (TIGR03756 family) [Pseudomonas sp. SORGH_AS_0199]
MSRSQQRLRRLTLAIPLATSLQATATVTTATIVSSSLSPECLKYKVVGVCYWLFCTPYGCKVKTSAKVRHFVPDAVVSSYANTGENPWTEIASFSPVISVAAGGNDPGDSATQANTTVSARFKNADVIGHPAATPSASSPAAPAIPAKAQIPPTCLIC